jgi:hypothetical protein
MPVLQEVGQRTLVHDNAFAVLTTFGERYVFRIFRSHRVESVRVAVGTQRTWRASDTAP